MKTRVLYRICVVAFMLIVGQTMWAQDAFYIYRNDGDFNGFFYDEVVRMGYSMIDLDSIEHDVYVVQEIELADTTYRIPLAAIDSIGFQQPEIRFNPRLKIMNTCGLQQYVSSVDLTYNTIYFKNLPSSMKVAVDDVLVGYAFSEEEEAFDIFAGGFSGVVESVRENTAGDGSKITEVSCRYLSDPGEVFDQYITVEKLTIDPQGNMSRRIAGLNPDGTLPQATTGNKEVNLIDFTSSLQREWQPDANSRVTLAAEVGVKFRVRVTYDIGWTKLFIKLTRDLMIDVTPSLGMSVSRGFDLDLRDLCKIPAIVFPANCPIFETNPIPTWFVRGEGKIEAKLTFPKAHLGLGEDIIIDTRRLFPIDYGLHWVPEEGGGPETPIDIGSTNVTFSGYLQTGIKFGANISTASWFEKLFFGEIALDLYAGPKVDGSMEFKTDWLNNEGFNLYPMLSQVNLNITGISLDLEAKAKAGVLWKDPVEKTFFSKNWSFLCDTLRLVPQIRKIKAEVKGDNVEVSFDTGHDKIFSYNEMQVGIYTYGYVEGEEPIKVVGDWVYRRNDSPYSTSFPVSDLKAGDYVVKVLVKWAGHGPYSVGSERLNIPLEFSADTDTLIFGSSGKDLVRSVRFKTNAQKDAIYVPSGELKVLDEQKGIYEAIFTVNPVYELFPLKEKPNSFYIQVRSDRTIVHRLGYSQETIFPSDLGATFGGEFRDENNRAYSSGEFIILHSGTPISVTATREGNRAYFQGSSSYTSDSGDRYEYRSIEFTTEKGEKGTDLVEGSIHLVAKNYNNKKELVSEANYDCTIEPTIAESTNYSHAEGSPFWKWYRSKLKTASYTKRTYGEDGGTTHVTYQPSNGSSYEIRLEAPSQ